jgi:hypothetical protein
MILYNLIFVTTIIILVWLVTTFLKTVKINTKEWATKIEKPVAYSVGSVAMLWTIERVFKFWS